MPPLLAFADMHTSLSEYIPVLVALVTGFFGVCVALISGFVTLTSARIQAGGKAQVKAEPASRERDTVVPIESPSPRRYPVINALLLISGVVLLVWGLYALSKISQYNELLVQKDRRNAEVEKEYRDKIAEKERQFEELSQSFAKVRGVTFNPVNVKSDYKPEGNTRLYRLWIEADRDVLERIDHVKYIIDDRSWRASPILRGEEADLGGRRHFMIQIYSYESLSYITVLVMYKDYKDKGSIQPINFHWRSEAKLVQ
jgi:hypothetical protein